MSYLDLLEQNGFGLNRERLLEKLAEGPRLVFLCNPNNPTGVPIPWEDVEWAAGACREIGALLAVDECFCDFLDDPGSCSVIPFLGKYPNLFVLKAFTKLYAMAGLRLGYGLCACGELMEKLERVRQPWSVSNVAQAAGLAALGGPITFSFATRRERIPRPRLSTRRRQRPLPSLRRQIPLPLPRLRQEQPRPPLSHPSPKAGSTTRSYSSAF